MVANFKKDKKEHYQQLIFSIILGVLIFLVVGFLVVSNWRIYQQRAALNTQLKTLQNQIQTLKERRGSLEFQVSQTSDKEYLEKEARERFNLKKPGEEVVTILPPEEKPEGSEGKNFWGSIIENFKF